MSNNCNHPTCYNSPVCRRPKKPKKIYRLPKMSAKRKKESRVYKKIVVEMARKDDECELKIPGVCTGIMNGLDHTQKRSPKNFLDKKNLKRACNACNVYKETSEGQKWAKENGHHISRFKKVSANRD